MRRAALLGFLGTLTLCACSGAFTPPRVGAIGGTYRAELQPTNGTLTPASATVEEDGHLVRVTLSVNGEERTFMGTASLFRAFSLEVNATRGESGLCGRSTMPTEALILRFGTEGEVAATGSTVRLHCENDLPRQDYSMVTALHLFRR